MSKSYNNTIPLWLPQKALRKAIMKIVTNSLEPGQPKDSNDSALYQIYSAFASKEQRAAMQEAFAGGIGWGDAKQQTFELIDAELSEARERYQQLVSRPDRIETILQAGARKARSVASPFMCRLREAVGIKRLG